MASNSAELRDIGKIIAQAFADVTFDEARAAAINKTTIKGFYVRSASGTNHSDREGGRITYIKLQHATLNITIEIADLPHVNTNTKRANEGARDNE